MQLVRLLSVTLILLHGYTQVLAFEEKHFSTIRHLGKLNGVALHCQSLSETQRIKKALVQNLPKRRQLGELFDMETNAAYLQFIKERSSCPHPDVLSKQVDAAILQLETVFKEQ